MGKINRFGLILAVVFVLWLLLPALYRVSPAGAMSSVPSPTPGSYIITVEHSGSGSITPPVFFNPGYITGVLPGANITFTFTPSVGYVISQVTDNGSAVSLQANNTYLLANIQGAHTINATFMPITFLITTTATGATISPSNPYVNYGSSTTFTVTANAGYNSGQVFVDGMAVPGNTYTFSRVTSTHSISANFTPINDNLCTSAQCVKIQNNQLWVLSSDNVNYIPYFVKAVGYQPMPIGRQPNDAGYSYTDPRFIDNNIYDDPAILNRDFPKLQQMNANTILIWQGDNTADNNGTLPTNAITMNTLNTAQQYGLKVIAGFSVNNLTFDANNNIYSIDDTGTTINSTQIISNFVNYVNSFNGQLAGSKALLFWAIGNQNNYQTFNSSGPLSKTAFENAFSSQPASYGDTIFSWLQQNNYLDFDGNVIVDVLSPPFIVTVGSGGANYQVGDRLYIEPTDASASGGATIVVTAVDGGGAITAVGLVAVGSGYTNASGLDLDYSADFIPPGSGNGNGATVNISNISPVFNALQTNFIDPNECNVIFDMMQSSFGAKMSPQQLTAWYNLVDQMALYAHQAEGTNFHPVAVINGEIAEIGNSADGATDAQLPDLDIWGVNAYRGGSFGTLFSDYQTKSQKPLWISGFGVDAYSTSSVPAVDINDWQSQMSNPSVLSQNQEGAAQVVNQGIQDRALWNEIVTNSNVTIGGSLMEYSDEWWKPSEWYCSVFNPYDPVADPTDYQAVQVLNSASNQHCLTTHSPFGSPFSAFPDGYMNPQWFGIMSISRPNPDNGGPDIVSPRWGYNILKGSWLLDPWSNLTLNISGSGNGEISSTPSISGAGLDCNYYSGSSTGTCTALFTSNQPVTLSFVSPDASILTNWSVNGCASGTATCNISPDTDIILNVTITASPHTYACVGRLPSNSSLCSSSVIGLTQNVPISLGTCPPGNPPTSPQCVATCNTGYTLSGGACVANTCSSLPAHSSACDNNLTPPTTSGNYSLVSDCPLTPTNCQAICKSGYQLQGGNCVLIVYCIPGTCTPLYQCGSTEGIDNCGLCQTTAGSCGAGQACDDNQCVGTST